MFSFLSAVIFSMSSNLDNFVIGLAFGIKKIKIGFLPNLLIALITVTGTVASMYVGKIAASFLPRALTDLLGASIIILLGLYFVLQSFSNLLMFRAPSLSGNPPPWALGWHSTISAPESPQAPQESKFCRPPYVPFCSVFSF